MTAARDSAAMEAVEKRQAKRGKDEVIITVYAAGDSQFSYSVQCCLGRFIRSVFPHQVREKYGSPRLALSAAVSTLRQWTQGSRSTKERLYALDLLNCPCQLELDFAEQ